MTTKLRAQPAWQTEDEEETVTPEEGMSRTAQFLTTIGINKIKEGYQTKAYLVLLDSDPLDSDHDNWGIIEDTLNNLMWEPGKGEVVGTWSRPRFDNRIHISLCTSISALQDRAIQTFLHYSEERKAAAKTAKPKSAKSPRAKKAAAAAQDKAGAESLPAIDAADTSIETKLAFNSLRARLGRAKR